MNFNVKHDSRTLCGSCESGVTTHDKHSGQMRVHCNAIGARVRFPVSECSAYQARGSLSLWDMKQQATLIAIDGKKVGFIRPGTAEHKSIIQGMVE